MFLQIGPGRRVTLALVRFSAFSLAAKGPRGYFFIRSKHMHEDQNEQREEILKLVRDGLFKADSYAKKYGRLDAWLLVTSIVLGTLATVLAGGTAAGGTPVMNSLGGWRVICSIVAVFTAVATISGTLHRTFQVTNHLAAAVGCIGKLKSLELAITVTRTEPREVAEGYRQIIEEYPACLS